MDNTFYMVKALYNGRECTNPSEFTTREEAVRFAILVRNMAVSDVKIEVHVYEVTEIAY